MTLVEETVTQPPPLAEPGSSAHSEPLVESHAASLVECESASLDALRTALSAEARRHTRATHLTAWAVTLLSGLGGLTAMSVIHSVTDVYKGALLSVLVVVLVCTLLLLDRSPWSRKRRQNRRQMAGALAEGLDVRSIGPLIDVFSTGDGVTNDLAMDTLVSLLPRLKATDASLLDEAHRAKLIYFLNLPVENPLFKDVGAMFRPARARDVAIRVAILNAFEQVGDSKALPVVERLAKRSGKSEGEKRIQEAALACLAALKLRVELADQSRLLLRAADAAASDEGTLLRAAGSGPEVEPEKLLRPM